MKPKVIKKEDELIVEFYRVKNYQDFRYGALLHMIENCDETIYLYVNTNNKKEEFSSKDILSKLSGLGLEYRQQQIEKYEKNLIDLSFLFKKKKKNALSEYILLVKIDKETKTDKLFDALLKYCDYGLGFGSDYDIDELFEHFKNNETDVLFSKLYFKNTMYDSLIFMRQRMDSPYNMLSDYMEGI